MTTILELEVNPQQEKLLKEMLIAMNITFRNQLIEETYSEKEIGKAVKKCFGIWKNREDFTDFNDFRKQAWGGRGIHKINIVA